MLTVKFVFSDLLDLQRFIDADLDGVFVETYDEGSYKEKKLAYKLKSSCGARKTPFAAVFDGDELIKAFYTEVDSNIIKSLIEYLHDSKHN
jgi:hypothetical protein